jgi:hypothetical protein
MDIKRPYFHAKLEWLVCKVLSLSSAIKEGKGA